MSRARRRPRLRPQPGARAAAQRRAGSVDEIAVLVGGPRARSARCVALARRAGVKVSYRTRDQLTAMAGSPHHQGVVARVAAADYADAGRPARASRPSGASRPSSWPSTRSRIRGTSGPCSGRAEAFGVARGHRAQAPRGRAHRRRPPGRPWGRVEHVAGRPRDQPGPRAGKAQEIRHLDLWGAGPTGGGAPWAADLTGPVCLVLGGEGEGLRPLVARTLRCPGHDPDARAGRIAERVGRRRRPLLRGGAPAAAEDQKTP